MRTALQSTVSEASPCPASASSEGVCPGGWSSPIRRCRRAGVYLPASLVCNDCRRPQTGLRTCLSASHSHAHAALPDFKGSLRGLVLRVVAVDTLTFWRHGTGGCPQNCTCAL